MRHGEAAEVRKRHLLMFELIRPLCGNATSDAFLGVRHACKGPCDGDEGEDGLNPCDDLYRAERGAVGVVGAPNFVRDGCRCREPEDEADEQEDASKEP